MIKPIYEPNIKEFNRLNYEFIELYQNDITALINSFKNEEGLVIYSCKLYRILQYQLAFILAYLFVMDYHTSSQPLSYYVEKYKLLDRFKYFACNDMNFDKIFETFGFTREELFGTACITGISYMALRRDRNPFHIGLVDVCSSDTYSPVDITDDIIEDTQISNLIENVATVKYVDTNKLIAYYEDSVISYYFTPNC